MTIGKVNKQRMIMACVIGDATEPKTNTTYELLISGAGSPIVRHPDGRDFELSWEDIVRRAHEAFEEDWKGKPIIVTPAVSP